MQVASCDVGFRVINICIHSIIDLNSESTFGQFHYVRIY